MGIDITEVQVTCIIIMALVTISLALIFPTLARGSRVYNCARRLLAGGTFLVMTHFCVNIISISNIPI